MKFLKCLFLVLLLPFTAFAGVNLKNGNFYISYTDIVVPGGGNDLKIVRTYNSKATEVGWFGFGWGSDYETYLTVAADGSVVVHENGSGAKTRFTPKEPVDPKSAAKKIIEAMRKKTSVSDKVASDLTKKLTKDAELRQAYARKFDVKASLATGTKLYSNTRGLQEVHKTEDGYKRVYNDGKVEHFNEDGHLVKMKDKNGYHVTLKYTDSGNVKSIKDSQAKQLFFDWYSNGLVKSISKAGNEKVHYKYEDKDLVYSKDIAGNEFEYDYDSNHNMVEIEYDDDSKKKISYTQKTQFVEKVVERDGKSREYVYDSNPEKPKQHYWTIVKKKGPSGKEVKNRYEYEIKTRPDGSQYTYRILTRVNGVETETIYSECCSLPLKIKKGKHVTNFEYNDKGLLTKKTSTSGEFIELEYDDKHNKISKVVNEDGWTKFNYNDDGNLERALNSEGKKVALVYDRKGRIKKMLDGDKKSKKARVLDFKYNALGKPVKITMQDVGSIFVSYDNYGEIKNVESKQGAKMALQVTQAFQSLLSIVKPAGVNLNM